MFFSTLGISGGTLPAVAAVVGSFVYLIARHANREATDRRRIDLVERALDSGAIDERTKRELVDVVAGGSSSRCRAPAEPRPHAAQTLGWIGLFAGLAMLGLSWAGRDALLEPGALVTAVSFGALSMPIAMRELSRRSA